MLLLASGFPDYPIFTILAAIIVIAMVLIGLSFLVQNHSDRWTFFLSVIFFGPLVILVIKSPDFFTFQVFFNLPAFFLYSRRPCFNPALESSLSGKAIDTIVFDSFLDGQCQKYLQSYAYRQGGLQSRDRLSCRKH